MELASPHDSRGVRASPVQLLRASASSSRGFSPNLPDGGSGAEPTLEATEGQAEGGDGADADADASSSGFSSSDWPLGSAPPAAAVLRSKTV